MSDLDKKLSIESGAEGFVVLKFHQVLNKQDIIDILSKLPSKDREEIFSKFQNENTGIEGADKVEEYEYLKPAGFDHAPQSAKAKWEELTQVKNVEKLQWIHDNVSYNSDHTMNILKLKKTFCEDISGQNSLFTFAEAQKLEKTNAGGYKLLTDYNDTDSDQEKKQSDWYRLIDLFSGNNGDTVEGMKFFRDMAGCNGRYWTATPYKDEKGKMVSGVARGRDLGKGGGRRSWSDAGHSSRVCGFKDSM